jgi:CRISPR-associated Csx2 family protein
MTSETILLTFLSGQKLGGDEEPVAMSEYKAVRYRFPGEAEARIATHFGLALLAHLKDSPGASTPERVVILGSAGSRWDHLLHLAGAGHAVIADWSDRIARKRLVKDGRFCPDLAKQLAECLGSYFRSAHDCRAEAVLIPPGENPEEQVQTLRIILDAIPAGARVWLDVTHGLRSMPLLGMLAAQLAHRLKGATILGLWYGALELGSKDRDKPREESIVPVMDLKGLLSAMEWAEADSAFAASGHLGALAEPLPKEEPLGELRTKLQAAADMERMMRVRESSDAAQSVSRAWPAHDEGIEGLFRERVQEHLSWGKEPNQALMFASLARRYLQRRDPLRAVVYAREAVVEDILAMQGQHRPLFIAEDASRAARGEKYDHKQVTKVLESYGEWAARNFPEFKPAKDVLKELRNAMAHVNSAEDKDAKTFPTDLDALIAEIEKRFRELGLP